MFSLKVNSQPSKYCPFSVYPATYIFQYMERTSSMWFIFISWASDHKWILIKTSQHISGHLDGKKGSLESSLVYCITKGNIMWLDMEGYIWLLQHTLWIILRFFMFQCSHMEVSAVSDFPGLMVQKCGQGLLYPQEEEAFG